MDNMRSASAITLMAAVTIHEQGDLCSGPLVVAGFTGSD